MKLETTIREGVTGFKMTRNHRAKEILKIAKAKRASALERTEFRYPSEARVSAAGATSFPVKAIDDETARLIAEYVDKRGANRP